MQQRSLPSLLGLVAAGGREVTMRLQQKSPFVKIEATDGDGEGRTIDTFAGSGRGFLLAKTAFYKASRKVILWVMNSSARTDCTKKKTEGKWAV